jgi:hypothetical protein
VKFTVSATFAAALLAAPAFGGSIESQPSAQVNSNFDIVRAAVSARGGELSFEVDVTGTAGADTPESTGVMLGSGVFAYVWPTSLDSSAVGFEAKQGIVALAVTAHPDFDDTPNYDEDGDGNAANDGKTWHSHWVVLTKDAACPAGLKVQDVAPGVTVKMPATAPGVPLLLDSPDVRPSLSGSTVTVSVPMPEGGEAMSFDGVAAGLRINAKMEAPLLCVTDVFKVASGDHSLLGKVAP